MPANEQPLKELAKLLGSKKGTWPVPPDQITTYQDRRYPPKIRLWSYLVEHSAKPGHRRGPATERGIAVTLHAAGKAVGLDDSDARKAWKELQQENRVRRDSDGKLWISGDFALGEEKAAEGCTTLLPDFYMRQINKLPEPLRAEFIAEEKRDREKRAMVIADLTASARFIFDQRQNSRFQRYGVKIIREKQKPKRGKEAEKDARDRRVLAILPEVERVVQPLLFEEAVQPQKSFVQPENRGAIRGTSEKQRKATAKAQQQPFDLASYPLTDSAITARFPQTSREYRGRIVRVALALGDSRINDESIAHAIEVATRRDQHSAGLYEQTVPETLAAWLRDADRRKTA